MTKISVTSNVKPGEIKKWAIDIAEKNAERVVKRLAQLGEQAIKEAITNTSDRPTGTLASAFFAIQFNRFHWGVGDIENLNDTVPYWRHVNFGSEAIGANWDHFLPNGPWNGVTMEGTEDKIFAKAKRPIQAHNYIEKTIANMQVAINQVISEG